MFENGEDQEVELLALLANLVHLVPMGLVHGLARTVVHDVL